MRMMSRKLKEMLMYKRNVENRLHKGDWLDRTFTLLKIRNDSKLQWRDAEILTGGRDQFVRLVQLPLMAEAKCVTGQIRNSDQITNVKASTIWRDLVERIDLLEDYMFEFGNLGSIAIWLPVHMKNFCKVWFEICNLTTLFNSQIIISIVVQRDLQNAVKHCECVMMFGHEWVFELERREMNCCWGLRKRVCMVGENVACSACKMQPLDLVKNI